MARGSHAPGTEPAVASIGGGENRGIIPAAEVGGASGRCRRWRAQRAGAIDFDPGMCKLRKVWHCP